MKDIYLIAVLYVVVALRVLLFLFPGIISSLKVRKICKEYIDSLAVAGIVAIFLITFVARSFYIPSESMVPTLLVNDYILVNKFVYKMAKPMRGDIVVFHPPHLKNSPDTDFVKRVVAVENDVVEIIDGRLILNGLPMDEPFIKEPPFDDFGPYRVPKGNIFMMGDNRNNSDDSRSWGPLPLENVVGKVFFTFWPWSRWKLF